MPELVLAPIVAPLLGGLFGGLEAGIMTAVPGVLGGLLATGAEGAITGGLIGAGTSLLTHGDVGKGALGGAITGGAGPLLGGALGDLGITGKAGAALSGAGANALGAAATGGNIGKAGLLGAAGGVLGNTGQPGPIPGGASVGASSLGGKAPTAGVGGASSLPSSNIFDSYGKALSTGTTDAGFSGAGGGASPGTQGLPSAGASGVATAANPPSVASADAGGAGGGLSGALSGAEKFLGGLSPGQILAGGGLALDLSKGNQTPVGYDQLKAQADAAAAQGTQLESYINSGQLPPGLKAGLDAANADAEASIRSEYAARGMSGSSAEFQDLQRAHQATVGKGAEMAIQLFQQGLGETQLSTQLYQSIMQESIAQDNQMADAIAKMAASFAQMGTPVSPGATASG